ncbi:hypothetical protein MYAM1_000205 [Malassezia yamatoensis]|uniref:PX domain-containing protein n=1 Tax=Malassezia yamatoensis TaxID=253288 RepID=A0AAJ5YRI6_9BASI|nr:hypothetical protein MYAM1_000205 [Malassezia yamatoensis]
MRKAFNASKFMGLNRRKNETEFDPYERSDTVDNLAVPDARDTKSSGAHRFDGLENRENRLGGSSANRGPANHTRDQYSDITEEMDDNQDDLASTYDSQEPEYEDEDESSYLDEEYDYDDDEGYDDDDYNYDTSTRPSGEYQDGSHANEQDAYDHSGHGASARPHDIASHHDKSLGMYGGNAPLQSQSVDARRHSDDYTESSVYSEDDASEPGNVDDLDDEEEDYASTYDGEPLDDDDEYIDDDDDQSMSSEHTVPADDNVVAAPYSSNQERRGISAIAAGKAGDPSDRLDRDVTRATSPSGQQSGGLLRGLRRRSTAPPPDAPTTRNALGAQRRGFLSRLQKIGHRRQPEQPSAKDPDMFRSNSIVGRSRGAVDDLEKRRSVLSTSSRTNARKDNAISMRDRAALAVTGGDHDEVDKQDPGATIKEEPYVNYARPTKSLSAPGTNDARQAPQAVSNSQAAQQSSQRPAEFSYVSSAEPFGAAEQVTKPSHANGRGSTSDYTSTSATPSHHRNLAGSSADFSTYSDSDYVSTVGDSTRAMEAYDQAKPSSAAYNNRRGMSEGTTAATTSTNEAVLLRDETRGRMPQLVDPFSKGMSLGRFSRTIPRPESIEPSLFDVDRDSAQQSSPLLPASGPLSAQSSLPERIPSGTSHNLRATDPVPAPPITAMSLAAPIDPTSARSDVPKSQMANRPIDYRDPSEQRRQGHSANPSIATTASTDFQSARTPSSPGQGLQSPARINTRASRKIASDLSPAERAKMSKQPQGGRALPGKRAAKRSASANADSLPPPVPPMPPMTDSQLAVPPPVKTELKPTEPLKLPKKDKHVLDSILPEDIVRAKERALPPPPPPNFRGLEHKTAHRRRSSHGDPNKRRLPLPKEPQNYLLTPSVAPSETDPEEVAEVREQSQQPKPTRSWLLSDLKAEEVHYFLRAIVGQELDWELDRAFLLSSFDKPVGRSRSRSAPLDDGDSRRNDFLDEERGSVMELDEDDEEAVFRRDVYDSVASSEAVDLPLLRFILKNAFCTFPLFVPPERRGGHQGRRPPPNKAAIARSFFFASILPILREWQARSLSAPIDRHGESDGTPFSGMSTTRAISMMLRKWTIKYITAVLRVGPGNPFFEASQAHNMGWPWPSAQLLPPEAYVSYRKPTDRLRLGGFEVDVVAVRIHSASERDFLLRVRRPNRLDEFVVRNDTDFEEFHAKLAQELGPFVHLRPLPRLPGRIPNRKPPTESSVTNSSRSYTSDQDTASYDYQDTEGDTLSHDTYDDQSRSTSYMTEDYSDDDDSQYSDETSTVRGGSSRGGMDRRAMYGNRPRPPPLYETDRRLLRAWLRDTLAIRTISDSQEVRAFFSIGSFNDRELDTNELLNIAERRRGDCRRIEERERDAELAGDNVLGIRRVMHRIWLDCVDGDGFLKVFDALKTTQDFWELPMSYQTVVSWGNLQIARFLYGIFVQGDESRANLARVRDMFDAIPWKKLANAMRLPASQMVGEWQKQFLRNRFLQTIFHIAFEDNPVAMDEDLRILQQSINSDTMIRKLRAYVESPEETKRLIRQHAQRADIPLVAAIVRGSDHPKLSKSEVQRVILATRAHSDFLKTNPTAAKKKSYNDPGYELIVDLQRVLRLYSLHRDVTQIRGMLQDPTILDALTIFFEPLIDALVRLHRVRGIRQDILDLRAYMLRLFDLLESLRARIQDPARSINILAAFLDRGTPGWYNFLYRWSDSDPVVFSTFAWLRHLAMTVGTGSEDLAGIWEPPLDLLEDPTPEPSMDDDVADMSTALRAASLAKLVAEGNHASSRPNAPPRLDETLVAEIRQLAEAARRKRARQMEIACRWSAGDTEGDFSIQVFGDGTGKMRSEPFLPKEPRPAPKLTAIERLRKSFREAVSSALAR